MDLSEKVGARIKKFRVEKGFTQEELAYRTGLQQSQIYRLESGKRRFNSDQIDKIAKALDVPIAEFFKEEIKMDEELDGKKLLEILSQIRFKDKKELVNFLHNLEDDIDLEILAKAVEIVKMVKKK